MPLSDTSFNLSPTTLIQGKSKNAIWQAINVSSFPSSMGNEVRVWFDHVSKGLDLYVI
jgi:hypothetical protein